MSVKINEHFWLDNLMLKSLSRIPNRDIYIITQSPPEQYSNSIFKIKEIGEEVKPLNEHKKGIKNFDDILGSPKCENIDQFFIRGGHNDFDIYIIHHNPILTYQKELYGIKVIKKFFLIKH